MKYIGVLFGLLIAVGLLATVSAISNPAAVYCQSLGYVHIVENTESGDRGFCIIQNNASGLIRFGEWDFFEGKVGQQYSYCAKKGYDLEIAAEGQNPYSQEYAVCVKKSQGLTVSSVQERTLMIDLMNLTEKLNPVALEDPTLGPEGINNYLKSAVANFQSFLPFLDYLRLGWFNGFASLLEFSPDHLDASGVSASALPSSFTWQDYNGSNWITPVKDQGGCNSCTAFAAAAQVEAKIKISRNDPNLPIDLSEQYETSYCAAPSSFGGICTIGGGFVGLNLAYIQSHGIPDESCFPYVAYDNQCSNTCSSATKRLWKIDSWGRSITPIGPEQTPTPDAVKAYLIDKGPLSVDLYMAGGFDGSGIYRCAPGATTNAHAVVIVGYNDAGQYWIAKNSWGSGWAESGFFKLGYGECSSGHNFGFYYIEMNNTVNNKNYAAGTQISTGVSSGSLSNTNSIDGSSFSLIESCSGGNCNGLDSTVFFNTSSIVNASFIDLIANQRGNNDPGFTLRYFNSGWNSLGSVPQSSSSFFLMKYNLCNSTSSCNSLLAAGKINASFLHSSCSSCSADQVDLDAFYLEAKANPSNGSSTPVADSDGDGVLDLTDACPLVSGSYCNGCPAPTCGLCTYASCPVSGVPTCANSDTNTVCNSVPTCSIGVGAGNYNILGGNYSCQNYCNGAGSCNYANSCTFNSSCVIKGTPSLSLSFSPGATTTYSTQTTVSALGCPSQLSCTFTRNGVSVTSPDVATLGAGTYNYTYTTSGNVNYTSAITAGNLVVNKASPSLSISLSSSSVTYPTQTTAGGSGCPSELACTFTRNGVTVSNSETATLGVGTYNYTLSTSGNANYSAASVSQILTVSQGVGSVSLLLNGTNGNIVFAYGSRINATATSSTGAVTLYKDGIVYMIFDSSGNGLSVPISAGYYNFTAVSVASTNYTSATVTRFLNVTKLSTSNLTVNLSSSSVAYSTSTTATGNGCLSGASCSLARNGANVVNPDSSTLAAGTYNYTYYSTGDTNHYANSSSSYILTVAKGQARTSLVIDKISPQTAGTAINASCRLTTGQGNPVLYRNGIDVSLTENGKLITLASGNHNYNCTIISTQNYTYAENISSFAINVNSSSNSTNNSLGLVGVLNTTESNMNVTQQNNSTIQFKQNGVTLLQFNYNLSSSTLNLSRVVFEKENSTTGKGFVRIKGIDLSSQNATKTVSLKRVINGTGLCLRDEELDSINDITSSCTSTNEFWLSCPGTNGNYSCILNGSFYQLSGLRHSAVIEQANYCGDSVCNGAETCSICSSDCGICPTDSGNSAGSSSGGGGGGSSSRGSTTSGGNTPSVSTQTNNPSSGNSQPVNITPIPDEPPRDNENSSSIFVILWSGLILFSAILFVIIIVFWYKKSHSHLPNRLIKIDLNKT